jgi:DNA-binding GntR family transcriptional regulator
MNKRVPIPAMPKAEEAPAEDRAGLIYRALRQAIMEQALEPGAKLPEDTIGERFGASRTLVRRALARLAGEGLVEMVRNRGAAVARPGWEEARDLFDLRQGLERLVMERLAGSLSAGQAAHLTRHVDEEEAAHGSNAPLSIRLAGEFHILLADMTGNAHLARYVGEVTSRSTLILAVYGRPHSSECAVSEHRAIIAALQAGDAAAACSLMDAHLRAVAERALIENKPPQRKALRDVLDSFAKVAAGGTAPARKHRKA